jgi:hypothetical protein
MKMTDASITAAGRLVNLPKEAKGQGKMRK